MHKIKETQCFWRTQVTEDKTIPIFFYLSVSHNPPLKMLEKKDKNRTYLLMFWQHSVQSEEPWLGRRVPSGCLVDL